MAKQEPGPCFVVIGIVIGVAGFLFLGWWAMAIGGFFFLIGICLIIQEANKPKTQTTAQPAAQPAPQPTPQPAPQPAPEQVPDAHRYCPHCGAQTTGKFCTDCGAEVD